MSNKTNKIVGLGLLTAIVVVLQVLAVAIRPSGVFNISLVLVPIVVGAALYGWKAGTWLGFVFGVVVVLTDASAFLAVNIPGTIITCLLKGMLAGLASGLIYLLIAKKSRFIAAVVAAIVCPIVNTGVFLLGCMIFFMDTINEWAAATGYENAGAYMIIALVGVNFIIEMAVNIVLSSAIVKIVDIQTKKKA
ncbi:MAG: ECF transporter S component [Ruminococcus sp.]|nr:ECF transporter S component [Ruminococcus sp.]